MLGSGWIEVSLPEVETACVKVEGVLSVLEVLLPGMLIDVLVSE